MSFQIDPISCYFPSLQFQRIYEVYEREAINNTSNVAGRVHFILLMTHSLDNALWNRL